jgi:hypothetical protein
MIRASHFGQDSSKPVVIQLIFLKGVIIVVNLDFAAEVCE